MIIVTSDNGPEFTAYRQWKRFDHDSVAGLRGLKADTWEGGHRVPFVVSWPAGGISGGRQVDGLVSQIDLFATIAALAGAEIPDSQAGDSINVLSTMLGQNESARETLVYHGLNGNLGLRHNEWVYLRAGGFGRVSIPLWSEPEWVRERRGVVSVTDGDALYNLREDPGQTRNVIENHPEILSELKLLLKQAEQAEQ